eukprot:COSAG05_NODE_229_length_13378_cov_4.728594_6_plen_613_part_00
MVRDSAKRTRRGAAGDEQAEGKERGGANAARGKRPRAEEAAPGHEADDQGMDDAIAMLAGMTSQATHQPALPAESTRGLADNMSGLPTDGPKLSAVAPQRHRVNSGGSSDSSDSSDSSGSSSDDTSDDDSDVSTGDGCGVLGSSDDEEGIWVLPHDPARPKRPQSAFFLYSAARRKVGNKSALTRAADSRAPESRSAATFQKEIGAEWQALDDAQKLPYMVAAHREKKAYERAMAAYKPPPLIQLPAQPTADEEKLYAKPLAAHRAAIAKTRAKRRKQAQDRAARQRKVRAEQAEAAKRAAVEERRRQARDIARLAERNRIGVAAAELAEQEEKNRKQKLSSRRGWMLGESGSSTNHGKAEEIVDDRAVGEKGNIIENLAPEEARAEEARIPETENPTSGSDDTTKSYAHVPMDDWRRSLDVWSSSLCQDVTGAWYEALVVDIRQAHGFNNGSTLPQSGAPGEVLIRYLAWDASFDEWVPRDSARLSARGTQQLAHMKPSEIVKLPEVTEEGALQLTSGTVVWLKWDSPGKDGHNEWFSAVIGKAVGGVGATIGKKKRNGLFGSRPKKKAEKSKLARCWEGWYKLQFTSFICDDPFDLRLAASQHRLRCQCK